MRKNNTTTVEANHIVI